MTSIPQEILDYIFEQACAIQQIPAPTFSEERRAAYVESQLARMGLQPERDAVGNVLARLPGGKKRPLVVSAHLDTVHPAKKNLDLVRDSERITGPGIGDNSISVAVLLGLARLFHDEKLPGDLWVVANIAEEGLGNLIGMQAVVDRFKDRPLAYIVLEGMGLGLIYHRGLGVHRYRVVCETPGGHSWGDYGMPSAIHELAAVITRITRLNLPKRPRTSLNVGMIEGGTSVNTIANRAWMELDLRSEDERILKKLAAKVKQRVATYDRPGVLMTMQEIGHRPAGEIPESHPLVRAAQQCLTREGITPTLEIGSTDANVPLSRGYPAVCIGLTRGSNAHTKDEYILVEPLAAGMRQLTCLIERAWKLPESVFETGSAQSP